MSPGSRLFILRMWGREHGLRLLSEYVALVSKSMGDFVLHKVECAFIELVQGRSREAILNDPSARLSCPLHR